MKATVSKVRHALPVVSQARYNAGYPRPNRISASKVILSTGLSDVCSTGSRFNRYS